jgi:peroxiredoxin
MSVPALKRLMLALSLVVAFGVGAPVRAQDDGDGDGEEQQLPPELKKISEQQSKAVEELNAKQYDKAIPRLEKLLGTIAKSSLGEELKKAEEQLTQYNLACGYSLTGKKDDSLKAFDRSLELGFWNWKHISEDTDLNAVRNEDAFKASVTKWKKAEVEDARAQAKKGLAGDPVAQLDPEMKLAGTKLKDMKTKFVVLELFRMQAEDNVTQLESLAEVQDKLKGSASIFGLCLDAGDQDLAAFAEEHGLKFDISAVTPKHPITKAKGLTLGTLVVDREGKVRVMRPRLTSGEAVEAMIKALDAGGDEPKKDEPKKDEPKKDEPKKDTPAKDEPF